ncbi:basic salivary proline-rich protein 3-like [Acomys russatus]|uniref:basic salivary proline-rich protein 3-like n=1 Tax=Acomys russatus TaxID=60746 RepID=UPI0021E32802|nr:basic salivary proline-rich protein 3-like [Acomys russatus]
MSKKDGYPKKGQSDPEKRKQLLNQTSSSGFTDSASKASGEQDHSATPRGWRSAAPAQDPGQAGRGEHPPPGTLAGHSSFGSPAAAADQLRPARPTLLAPPGPPERGPRPRGAERAGAAERSAWGAPAASASSPEPRLRSAGRSPPLYPPGYSPVAEEGLRGMGPLTLPSHTKSPLPGRETAATGPGAGKVLCGPPPPPPLLGRGVVSLTQEDPLKQPPPF